MVKKKFNSTKYASTRRKLLKEEMKLVYERDKLTSSIRKVRKEMVGWDKFLMLEGEYDNKRRTSKKR